MALFPDIVPERFRPGATAAAGAIARFDKTLIAGHIRPDGDDLGAIYACGWIEKFLKRQFVLYLPDGAPEYLGFLAPPGQIIGSLSELPFQPEAAIYVDCSEPGRLGTELEAVCGDWPSVNIDHHLCERGLGSEANFINPRAAAACQLVAYVATSLRIPLAGELGNDIGVGIITDTGNFTHNNASAQVFALAALLEENGVHLAALGEKLRSGWSLNRLRFWGFLFTQVGQAKGNRIAWSIITEDDLKNYHCSNEDLEGYIDCLGRLKSVEIAFTLRGSREPYPNGHELAVSRLSMRSKGNMNAREICSRFGGGGHKNAAGATINADPWQALPDVLNAIDAFLDENGL